MDNRCRKYKYQEGGCGEIMPTQMGGDKFKKFDPNVDKEMTEAQKKSLAWRMEVAAVREELQQQNPKVSFKTAMVEAARRRKEKLGYQTTKDRYIQRLKEKSKQGQDYEYTPHKPPTGHKYVRSHRPVTFSAAQEILKNYYRDNADKFKRGPLAALRNDISRCRGTNWTLNACPDNVRTRAEAKAAGCDKSWKYRPTGKFPSGPGKYDIAGLDNLCLETDIEKRRASPVYNVKYMRKMRKGPAKTRKDQGVKRVQRKGNPDYLVYADSTTGKKKYVKQGGKLYNRLQQQGVSLIEQ